VTGDLAVAATVGEIQQDFSAISGVSRQGQKESGNQQRSGRNEGQFHLTWG
jgi:hypothetical protein